jgi:F0F1-type ATP synthase assembly protein I
MTETYKIKQTSIFLWLVSLLGTIYSSILLIASLIKFGLIPSPQGQPIYIIALVAPITFFAFKVPNHIASADIELTIDEDGLNKKWLKQFPFLDRPDIKIYWTDMKDFVYQPERQFDKFKITLKDGTKFKFHHNNDHRDKDDFQKFQLDFEKKVSKLNNDSLKKNNIKQGKTIYETAWGLISAIIGVIAIVGLIIVVLFSPFKKTTNYAMLWASLIGTIYFIYQVYVHRKKKKVD